MSIGLITHGLQGPPGPAGQGYTAMHEQFEPLAEWRWNHNMNKYPTITIVDLQWKVIGCSIEYIDPYTVCVRFYKNGNPFPYAGRALAN